MSELTYVIPLFNRVRLLERTICSIIDQAVGREKIIVVDDGSTEEITSVVSKYESELTLLHQPNAGPSAARNAGLHAVNTEIVCFIDSDDYVIGPHRRAIEKRWNKNVDMMIGLAAEGNDSHIVLSNQNKYGSNSTNYSLIRHFMNDNCVQTSTICWSTMFLRKIGGWDEELFGIEDIELAMRALLLNARVMISNSPGWVVWHRHPDQPSQKLSARIVNSQVSSHRKLMALIEKANRDPDISLPFFRHCMGLGRSLYLNGFRREAMEVMSIAWKRGYTQHSGPLLESVLAKYFGTRPTLSARSLIGDIKRNLIAALKSGA